MSARPAMPRDGSGSVRSDEILRLSEAARRLGWGARTVRHALRAGLTTTKFGRARYVTGIDVLTFFTRLKNGDTR